VSPLGRDCQGKDQAGQREDETYGRQGKVKSEHLAEAGRFTSIQGPGEASLASRKLQVLASEYS
jgi:hypothetical protein